MFVFLLPDLQESSVSWLPSSWSRRTRRPSRKSSKRLSGFLLALAPVSTHTWAHTPTHTSAPGPTHPSRIYDKDCMGYISTDTLKVGYKNNDKIYSNYILLPLSRYLIRIMILYIVFIYYYHSQGM